MASSHIGNGDAGLGGFLHDPQFLVDGIPSTALNTRVNLNTLCIQRHSRMTRLTPSSYLRQTCPVEMGAAPAGHRLSHARTARLAALEKRPGDDGGVGARAGVDREVRDARTRHDAVLAEIRQRAGVHLSGLYAPRGQLWPPAGVHHAALPAAKRNDRASDSNVERTTRIGHIHPAKAAAPLVERGIAEPVLAPELLHGRTSLHLLQEPDDLLVSESRLLHARSLLGNRTLLTFPWY